MTWSQYLAFRLGARQTSEVTALGALSQLLDVRRATSPRWCGGAAGSDRFAPLTRAWEDIGELERNFARRRFPVAGGSFAASTIPTPIICATSPRVSAIWRCFDRNLIIGFESGRTSCASIPIAGPSPSPTYSGARSAAAASSAAAISSGSLPALRPPPPRAPESRRSSRAQSSPCRRSATPAARSPAAAIRPDRGSARRAPAQRASLATLYVALMAAEALDALESHSPIVIDGPFARNDLFCSLLAAFVRASGLLLFAPGRDGRRRRRARAHALWRLPERPRRTEAPCAGAFGGLTTINQPGVRKRAPRNDDGRRPQAAWINHSPAQARPAGERARFARQQFDEGDIALAAR